MTRLAGAMMVALALACTTGRTEQPLGEPMPPMIAVRNDNFADVTAYVLRNGARFRLGMVHSMTTETFKVVDTPTPIRVLVVTFASGERFATEELVVRANQRLDLTVAGMISTSSYMLTNR